MRRIGIMVLLFSFGHYKLLNVIAISLLTTVLPSSDYFPPCQVRNLWPYQVSVLNEIYSIKPYPTNTQKEMIASTLEVMYATVNRWFRYKRSLKLKAQSDTTPLGK